MGLTMQERHAIIRELSSRFQRSGKKERSEILNNVVQLTGYTRCYAAFVLRTCGRKQVRTLKGKRVVFIPGYARAAGTKRHRRGHYRTKAFLEALTKFWALSDGLCGKRLVAFLREIVPLLERQGRLHISDPVVREQLVTASAATIDRLMASTKRQSRLKGRSSTRPGTLLKHHIAVKTFADWSDVRPGFCQADLVAHDGGSGYGDFAQTLTLTDVATCWTETEAAKNKARVHVFAALKAARTRLLFPLLGLDSDNGSEFINNHLKTYCEQEHITFTRSRAYHKNDNCYVEQKNNSIVRRTVGHYRYNTPRQLELLRTLYHALRPYTNFFLPVMKLKEKVRQGSKLTRRYNEPLTPYRRVLEHPQISENVKAAFTRQYESLNIIELKRVLGRLQQALFHSALKAGPPPQPPPYVHIPPPDHPWNKSGTFARPHASRQQEGPLPTGPRLHYLDFHTKKSYYCPPPHH
jgi:Integrase core domain